MAAAQDRASRAKTVIAELEHPDIAALAARSEELEGLFNQAVAKEAGAKARAEQLKKLAESIAATVAALEKAENVYAPLGELADILRGNNSARINLETFAIASMFDRVLDAANLRLRPMTGGRYSLERRQGRWQGRCAARA
jgi:DNA repair protein SbcC/Rad50